MYASIKGDDAPSVGDVAPVNRTTVTVEHGLYGLVLLVGSGLRLFALDSRPLIPLEAASAWPAWLSAMALTVPNAPQPVSALLHSFQVATVWLAQGNETAMRLLPALCGATLILLPWFWRRWLGRGACLVAAGLIAMDPWLTTLSRTGDGAMVSAFLGALTLTALLHIQAMTASEPASPGAARWRVAAAISCGLLFVSGVQAWSWLLLVITFVLTLGVHCFSSLWRWSTLAWFAGVAILVATRWFSAPQDAAIVSAGLSDWLGQVWNAGYPLAYPWIRLAVDQPFLVVFGVLGVFTARLTGFPYRAPENGRLAFFWLIWLILSVVLLLAPGRTPDDLPLLSLALIFPASLGVAALAALAVQEEDWREGGLLLAVMAALFLSLLFWFTAIIYSRAPDGVLIRSVAVLVILGLFLVVAFAIWISRRQALLVGMSLLGAALLAASLSATWRLSFENDPRRLAGFFAATTHSDVRQLALDAARVSAHRLGDASELPVQIVTGPSLTPNPSLSWALRKMRNLSWRPAPEPGAESDPRRAPIIITPGGSPGPEDSGLPYIGSDYRVSTSWLPSALPTLAASSEGPLWDALVRPWLRWAIYREAPAPPQVELATLWTLGE
jgi:hypothetical protein